MGFDEARNDDIVISSEGIALVVTPAQRDLIEGMTLDYVELEADDFRFIFINPNDTVTSDAPEVVNGDGNCDGTGEAQ